MPIAPGDLLESRFLTQLERVRFSPSRVPTEREMGDQASRRHGSSVEFVDYRDYQPGDDFRSIDWTLAARLDRLFVRLFRAEENLRLELLLDCSESMHFGQPEKFEYALRLAASLGFIALRHGDRVTAALFNTRTKAAFANTRGRQATATLFRFLANSKPSDGTNLNNCLRRLALSERGSAVSIVVSDLMDQAGYEQGLDALVRSGRRVCLVHLLSAEEVRPDIAGEFEWIDSEDQSKVEITVDAQTLRIYQETLSSWLGEIRSYCNSRRIDYYQVNTAHSLQELILHDLRRGGLLA